MRVKHFEKSLSSISLSLSLQLIIKIKIVKNHLQTNCNLQELMMKNKNFNGTFQCSIRNVQNFQCTEII